jgi:hypothetical protein
VSVRGGTVVWLLVLVGCLARPMTLAAQEPSAADAPEADSAASARRSKTYLAVGLAHWQGNIFSKTSLTKWDGDLFDTTSDLTGVNVEVAHYFGETRLQLSGLSIGYRKDVVRRADSGHMFSGMLFRTLDLKVVAIKAGAGVEWGIPSYTFDQTQSAVAPDGTVEYRHIYPTRNQDVPHVGTTMDGAMYPFVQMSLVERQWRLLFETGMRVGIMRFNFDDYTVSPTDEVTPVFTQKRVLVPYLFANVGIQLF